MKAACICYIYMKKKKQKTFALSGTSPKKNKQRENNLGKYMC